MKPRQTILAQVMLAILHHREGFGWYGILLALFGYLSLEWVVHSTAPLLEHLFPLLAEMLHGEFKDFTEKLGHAAAPVMVCVAVGVLFYRHLRSAALQVGVTPPSTIKPSRGLLASISPFKSPSSLDSLVFVAPLTDDVREQLRTRLYESNWGPLAAAVEIHSGTLSHLWLLRTPQIDPTQLDRLSGCLKLLAPGLVIATIPIENANNIEEVRVKVSSFFDTEPQLAGLGLGQVATDITSGNSTMTAGLILATLDETRPVQYLKQLPGGPGGLLRDGQALPLNEVMDRFVAVKTSPRDVVRAYVSFLEHRTGHERH